MTLEEIGNDLGFITNAKVYRTGFYDKYIRPEYFDYSLIYKYPDLIEIYKLHNKIDWKSFNNNFNLSLEFINKYRKYFKSSVEINDNNKKTSNKYIKDDVSFKKRNLEEIIIDLNFTSNAKDIKAAFRLKYINIINYNIIIKYPELIFIFNLHKKINWLVLSKHPLLTKDFVNTFKKHFDKNTILKINQ